MHPSSLSAAIEPECSHHAWVWPSSLNAAVKPECDHKVWVHPSSLSAAIKPEYSYPTWVRPSSLSAAIKSEYGYQVWMKLSSLSAAIKPECIHQQPGYSYESCIHYNDVIMGAMASQISLPILYPTVYSSTDQRKHHRFKCDHKCLQVSKNDILIAVSQAWNSYNIFVTFSRENCWIYIKKNCGCYIYIIVFFFLLWVQLTISQNLFKYTSDNKPLPEQSMIKFNCVLWRC